MARKILDSPCHKIVANVILDDMECDPHQPLSDLHQQDQLSSESNENSPSQQDRFLCDNLDSNHPSSSLDHTFSHVESLSHPKFEVLKNVHIQKTSKKCGRPPQKSACLSFANSSHTKKKEENREAKRTSKEF